MSYLDLPDEWTLVSEVARDLGISPEQVLAMAAECPDAQLTGSGAEMMVCRLNP